MVVNLLKLPKDEALNIIADKIKNCHQCRLSHDRTKSVPGQGSPEAKAMFIGEAPGFNEDQRGIPFCGRAGRLLDQALDQIKWQRQDVFITNIVKCRPPNNRDPEADEINYCQPFLNWQIKIIQPLMIITLGRFSMAKFLPGVKISQVHGQIYPVKWRGLSLVVAPLYHPAAALRNGSLRQVFFTDFDKLPGFLKLAEKGFWFGQEKSVTQEAEKGSNQLKLI